MSPRQTAITSAWTPRAANPNGHGTRVSGTAMSWAVRGGAGRGSLAGAPERTADRKHWGPSSPESTCPPPERMLMPGPGMGSTCVVKCLGREGPVVPKSSNKKEQGRGASPGRTACSRLHTRTRFALLECKPVVFLPEVMAMRLQEPQPPPEAEARVPEAPPCTESCSSPNSE